VTGDLIPRPIPAYTPRPNPYAVVALEEMQLHLFGIAGFNPTDSYGTAIVEVPDPDTLYLDVAARLGDSHGVDARALRTLESGLARHPDAPAVELARAYLFRAELAHRTNNHDVARTSLMSAQSLELSDAERASLDDEFAHVASIVRQAPL
jgi:hypothetical protein